MAQGTLSAANDTKEFHVYCDTDHVAFSLSGTFVGTVALQRRMGGDWRTIQTYTAPIEEALRHSDVTKYRAIMTAYTSGSAVVDLK